MEGVDGLMPSFVANDGATPSSVALWQKGRAITGSNTYRGTLPPSFAVRREGRDVLSSHSNDGAVPLSVDDGLVPSFVTNNGALPLSFTLWWEEWGVTDTFIFEDTKGMLSFTWGR